MARWGGRRRPGKSRLLLTQTLALVPLLPLPAQARNDEICRELDAARHEASERIERSTQFSNMRQMLSKKNSLVREASHACGSDSEYPHTLHIPHPHRTRA